MRAFSRTRYTGRLLGARRSEADSGAREQGEASSPLEPGLTTSDASTLKNNVPKPGVSILRPLRGLDTNLYENLEASFLQQYPTFEILFSVADDDDPAVPIVRELMQKYSHVPAQLVTGQDTSVVNPKIRNMLKSYRAAKHDILWVIDSNVLTSVHTLANSVQLLTAPQRPGKRAIGLVHHLPFAIYPDQQLGSRVEQVFLCSTHAKMYLAINAVAVASCVTGKSCLYRKSDLERAAEKKRLSGKGHQLAPGDGLAAFGQYLGEDNMIGEAIWDDLGMRHAMGGDIAGNAVGSMTYSTYFRRRVRWIRVRKYMVV
ncbi:Ceramide glucosyltransferase, partial [Microbotryomycetes sp. JL201]